MVVRFCTYENHVDNIPRMRIEEIPIEQVSNTKVLCVTLSNNLSWNAHKTFCSIKIGNSNLTKHKTELSRGPLRRKFMRDLELPESDFKGG